MSDDRTCGKDQRRRVNGADPFDDEPGHRRRLLRRRTELLKERRDEQAERNKNAGTDPDQADESSPRFVYPYAKGPSIVNDGVAYGERLDERRVRTKAGTGTVERITSLRTRSGRIRDDSRGADDNEGS